MTFTVSEYRERYALISESLMSIAVWAVVPLKAIGYFPYKYKNWQISFVWNTPATFYALVVTLTVYLFAWTWYSNIYVVFELLNLESSTEKTAYCLLITSLLYFSQACRFQAFAAAHELLSLWHGTTDFFTRMSLDMRPFEPQAIHMKGYSSSIAKIRRKIRNQVLLVLALTIPQCISAALKDLPFEYLLVTYLGIIPINLHTTYCQLQMITPQLLGSSFKWLAFAVNARSTGHSSIQPQLRDGSGTKTQKKDIESLLAFVTKYVSKIDAHAKKFNSVCGRPLLFQGILQLVVLVSCFFLASVRILKGEDSTWVFFPVLLFLMELKVSTENGEVLLASSGDLCDALHNIPTHLLSDDAKFKVQMLSIKLNTYAPKIEPRCFYTLNSQFVTWVLSLATMHVIMLVQFQMTDLMGNSATNQTNYNQSTSIQV